jgi:ferredoxin
MSHSLLPAEPPCRAQIHCFSGTGNTLRAASLIAEELRAAGWQVATHRVGRGEPNPPLPASRVERETLNVFCFPIYACGIPDIMTRYLRRLPKAAGARAAVICTMGDIISYDGKGKRHHVPGFEGHALMQAAGTLRRHGYDVFLTDALPYPLRWTQAVNAPEPRIDAELLGLGDSRATAAGRRIATGEHGIRRFGWAHALWTIPFDALFKVFGRRGLGKLYVADGDCNACGLCARACPARAIRLIANRPRWNWTCEGCQRCINLCPRNAIQTSWLRLSAELLHMLILVPFLLWRLGPRSWVPVRPVALEVFFWLGAYAAFTWLLDESLFVAGLVPGVRRTVEWNLSKRFRRYLEPHYEPEQEPQHPDK